MARRKPFFIVGLFIILGTILGVTLIVWVGAYKYFQKGNIYVTYFDESVQGLQIDSRVKYQGVDVGWVTKIGIAPDYKLIEVVMKIDFQGDLVNNTIAKLEAAGITGIVYVGLERRKPVHQGLSPKIEFPAPYPVIPSVPSDIQKIFTGINAVVEKAKQIDFKAISDQIRSTSKSIEIFINDRKIQETLDILKRVASNIENASEKVNGLLNEKDKVENILLGALETISDARRVVNNIDREIQELKFKERLDRIDYKVYEVTKKTDMIASELFVTTENLRKASEYLEGLLERLYRDPSDILFSTPPDKD
ncbi:MAG: MlaD family protein [Syntrophorhabdaceae bacterium]|nr:MlaD family protein [Syntrophorhabdaceae bacterium]